MQGNLEALKQVMSQTGMDAGVLDQQMPGSPGAMPNATPTPNLPQGGVPTPMGQPTAPQPMPSAQPSTTPQGQGLPIGNPEADIILKALDNRLKTISKLDMAQMGM